MQNIGWIGTGIMGCSMAQHLLAAGYPLSVYSRTKSKADELVQQGAVWRGSPADVAEHSDIVFTMVGYPRDVEEVVLGSGGVLQAIRQGGIIVDMTTSSPELARKIAEEAAKKNVVSLDAPVTGGDVGAKNATLSIMLGGDEKTVLSLEPIWYILGKTVVYHGPAGSGHNAKLVNQIMIAGTMLGLCEALVYAKYAGLDLEKVLQSVSTGAAGSWSLSNLAPRILKQDYAPGFRIEHFVKDLALALEEHKQMNAEFLKMHCAGIAKELYSTLEAIAADEGKGGKLGTQALVLLMGRNGNTPFEP